MTDADLPEELEEGGAIAIIGMAGRYPGSPDLDAYWDNLRNGVESISRFTEEEVAASGIVDPASLRDPNYVKARATLEDVALFDAALFGINPREADALDPQQRLFLECAWQALENAGYDPLNTPGAVGMWGGCAPNTYARNNLARNRTFLKSVGGFTTAILNYANFLTTRVSYKLNLKGPSVEIQTACSTSLVAVVHACHSLLTYQCDMALAGGVAVGVPQKVGYVYTQGEIFSEDGHCRPFDHKATGTVGGEGVGIVVLKRLEDAVADGDRIRAVVRGAAMNNDGSNKVGFTAPSVEGQAEVIAAALALAEVDPTTIGYVEAHGTATPLGDPIEIAALTRAYRDSTDAVGFCGIGSVKSNIAHADTAAGAASLIKTVLALENELIPPSLHFDKPNPEIQLEKSPFYVVSEAKPWARGDQPRRAGVSSFGIGGTNAHVIVEEAPLPPAPVSASPTQLVVLSAKTESALETATANLVAHLRSQPDLDLADVAFTTQVGRHAFAHRRAVVCGTVEAAAESLTGAGALTGLRRAEDPPVVFMFPGQGAQHVDMARGLYDTEPVFAEHLDACAEILQPHLQCDLREVLYPAEHSDEAEALLRQTRITQPAVFAVEYALAKLWMHWGVQPSAMVGHSVGEFVAACLGGVLSLEDALALVAARGQMMQDLPEGDMLSVPLAEKDVQANLGEALSIAAVNSPSNCVVSGSADAVAVLQQQFEALGLSCTMLHTSHAFHSAMMEPIVAPFTERVRQVTLSPCEIPCISTVTGAWIDAADWADPEYWARNLRQPVRFSEAALAALQDTEHVLLEVGPGQTLTQLVRKHRTESAGRAVVSSMRRPQQAGVDLEVLLGALGQMWIAGVAVDWQAMHGEGRQRVPLPTYPFERRRYWVDPELDGADPARPRRRGVAADVADWFYAPSWTRSPGVLTPSAALAADEAWVVLAEDAGAGAQLAERLRESGRVVCVSPAGAAGASGEDRYGVRPGVREDLEWLLGELRKGGVKPRRIVHAWSAVPPSSPDRDAAQARGFYTLLALAQALSAQLPNESVQIDVVAEGLFEVTGNDAVGPERATVIGPCTVIPLEYENVACRLIDAGDVDAVRSELLSTALEPVVAYRGVHRWIQTYEPAPLTPPTDDAWCTEGGAYLVTGGLGGVGLALAQKLVEACRAKLVLVGRTELPPRDNWQSWIDEHGAEDRTSRRIRGVLDLEESGAEVLVLAADVSDAAQMRAAVDQARSRFGAIAGVIHAAGLATGGLIETRVPDAAAEVLDPKVAGTLVLADCLGDEPDFVLLCSSINSISGGLGMADYCGANAFLDAYAQSRAGGGTRVVSVNWDTWSEVGMAVDTALSGDLQKARERDLRDGIGTVQGQDALARILACSLSQVVVSPRDLQARLDPVPEAADAEAVDEAAPDEPAATAHARPNLTQAYVAPEAEVEIAIATAVGDLLGIDKVGVHDNFFDLGFDSLLGHRLIGRMRELGMTLPLRVILEIPTVAQIAEFIEGARAALAPPKPDRAP